MLFAPGWRDPNGEGFWSYAFVMWINEPAPDAARLDDFLEKYYNGLMTAVAADKGKDISPMPAPGLTGPGKKWHLSGTGRMYYVLDRLPAPTRHQKDVEAK